MDNLFTLIAIVIVVVSVVRKIKAKQKSSAGAAAPAGGWVTKLHAFFADIQRQIEQKSSVGPADASAWRQLMEGDSQADSLEDLDLEEEETPPAPKKMPPVSPGRVQKIRSDQKQTIPGAPQRSALGFEKRAPLKVARNRAELRKAVIWSEIFGPPVSLKDQQSGHR
jgi:hypothetical protein